MTKNIGCKVTTITMSEKQFQYAKSIILREKLDSLIDIRLYDWQTRFKTQSEKLLKLGYNNYFQNVWNFYFSYCQAGFLVENIRDAHLVYKKI